MKKVLSIFAIAAVMVLSAIALHISPSSQVSMGQSASYVVLGYTVGAPVNGRPSFIPTTQTVDSQNVLAASLVNSTTYDISTLKESGRMVNIGFTVTTVPSSSPSMTPQIQQSDDGGQNWYLTNAQDGTTFAAITATGTVAGKDFPLYGDLLRIHYASATGTGANFNFTSTAKQAQ